MAPAGIGAEVEGLHAVAAALEAGRVRILTVERNRLRHGTYADLRSTAERQGIPVTEVDDVRDLTTTEAPQGVVASCEPIPPVELGTAIDLIRPSALLVLDHLQDPRNLGAVARSAHAAGIPALVVPERRAAPIGATAFKAAAGALEHVAVVVVGSVADALARLRTRDVWLVGLDGSGDDVLFGNTLLTEPVAVVVGSEGSGLSRLVAERCDIIARIPMVNRMESLNVSVAASLAAFEVARARGAFRR